MEQKNIRIFIKEELARIQLQKSKELLDLANQEYEKAQSFGKDELNFRKNKFEETINNKKITSNKKTLIMKKIILLILVFLIGYGAYHFFFKDNKTVKDIEYSLTTTPISDILDDPRGYQGKSVSVSGRVVSSFNLGIKYYLLNDGTGEIYVMPTGAVPKENETVKATGIFKQKLKIGHRQISVIEETQ